MDHKLSQALKHPEGSLHCTCVSSERSAQLPGSLSFARDRATAFMCSIVISVLSVLLEDWSLLLPSLTVVLRLISLDMHMAGMM